MIPTTDDSAIFGMAYSKLLKQFIFKCGVTESTVFRYNPYHSYLMFDPSCRKLIEEQAATVSGMKNLGPVSDTTKNILKSLAIPLKNQKVQPAKPVSPSKPPAKTQSGGLLNLLKMTDLNSTEKVALKNIASKLSRMDQPPEPYFYGVSERGVFDEPDHSETLAESNWIKFDLMVGFEKAKLALPSPHLIGKISSNRLYELFMRDPFRFEAFWIADLGPPFLPNRSAGINQLNITVPSDIPLRLALIEFLVTILLLHLVSYCGE